MTSSNPAWSERAPADYLDHEGGLRFVLAAAWLFCPEAVVNHVELWTTFGTPLKDDDRLGECWRGVLSARYPDREITVTPCRGFKSRSQEVICAAYLVKR